MVYKLTDLVWEDDKNTNEKDLKLFTGNPNNAQQMACWLGFPQSLKPTDTTLEDVL